MGGKPCKTPLRIEREKVKKLEAELEEAWRNQRVPEPPGGGFALEPQRQTWLW